MKQPTVIEHSGHKCGKTTRMIGQFLESPETDRFILVRSLKVRDALLKQFPDLTVDEVETGDTIKTRLFRRSKKRIAT